MGGTGIEGRVEEREKGGTKCQCDGGFKYTFTRENICVPVANSDTAVNPLMFIPLPTSSLSCTCFVLYPYPPLDSVRCHHVF